MLVSVCKLLKFPKLIFLCQSLKLRSYCIYFRTCSTENCSPPSLCVNHSQDHKTVQFCIGTFKWQKIKKGKGKREMNACQIHSTLFPSSDFTKYQQGQYLTYKETVSPEWRAAVEVLKMRRPFPRNQRLLFGCRGQVGTKQGSENYTAQHNSQMFLGLLTSVFNG